MPWKELSVMSQRHEFVTFAAAEGVNLSDLCRRYGITRPTGYKWAKRFGAGGVEALADRPRRPHRCPRRTPPEVERLVLRAATWDTCSKMALAKRQENDIASTQYR